MPDLFPPKQHQLFLIDFCETVNGLAADRRIFRRRRALCNRTADRTMHFPVAFAQLFDWPDRWKNQPVIRTNAGAFAVNGLR